MAPDLVSTSRCCFGRAAMVVHKKEIHLFLGEGGGGRNHNKDKLLYSPRL